MIMKHLKIKIMSIAFMAVATSSMAQSLNKMNWLNEPQQWEIKDGKTFKNRLLEDFSLWVHSGRRTFLLCDLWWRI